MPSPLALTRASPTRLLQGTMFDRTMKARQRSRPIPMDRAVLHKTLAAQMFERRQFIKQETPVVLEVGAHTGWYLKNLLEDPQRSAEVKQYIQLDLSAERLTQIYDDLHEKIPPTMEFVQMQADEEDPLPVPDKSVDMIISNLSAHWVNNLEKSMINIRKALKKDGFLILTMFGGNTLYELRGSMAMAEQERDGGISPHTNPMIDGAGISTLMLQSGFHFPTIDMDRHNLHFHSMFHLMEFLQDMGENNAMFLRKSYLSRDTFTGAAALYDAFYKSPKTNLITSTFEVFHVLAWAPNADRPVSTAPRGSAKLSLKSISTPTHKEFQDLLEKLGQEPQNEHYLARAEELLEKLKEEGVAVDDGKGEESNGNEDEYVPPPPPGDPATTPPPKQ